MCCDNRHQQDEHVATWTWRVQENFNRIPIFQSCKVQYLLETPDIKHKWILVAKNGTKRDKFWLHAFISFSTVDIQLCRISVVESVMHVPIQRAHKTVGGQSHATCTEASSHSVFSYAKSTGSYTCSGSVTWETE